MFIPFPQTSTKRKLKSDESPILRKSIRIDNINNNQKKIQEPTPHNRRAFQAEEKLKKLAEQADLAKKLNTSSSSKENNSPNSQGKPEASLTRRKIQLVLQTVKKVQKKTLISSQATKKLLIVGKKQQPSQKSTKAVSNTGKVVSTKVIFQRHSKKNQSQRSTAVSIKTVDKKLQAKNVTSNQNISKGSESGKYKTTKKVSVGGESGGGRSRNRVQQTGMFECVQYLKFTFSCPI